MGEEVEKVEPRPVAEYKWKARAQAAEAQVEAMRRKITVAHILCCGTAPKQAVGEVLASALDALSVPAEERGSSSAESAARRPADGCDQTLRAALEPFARFHEAMEHMGRSFPRSGEWYGLESSVTGERKLMVEDFARARAALASSTPESSVGATLFVGWAALAPNGNVRLWSRDKARVDALAREHGLEIVRLVRAPLLGDPPRAVEALKTALDHIEHMSTWIADKAGGYSFESLGEDMGDMRAALNAATAPAEARSARPLPEALAERLTILARSDLGLKYTSRDPYTDGAKLEVHSEAAKALFWIVSEARALLNG